MSLQTCLQGAVGLAIWVPSVANRMKESDKPDTSNAARGYSSITHADDDNGGDLELSVVGDDGNLEAIDKELLLDNLQVEKFFLGISF